VKYPRFSGTNVPRDFVEFPSQVNEMWATWPEVLKNYARHYQTGAPIPQALLDKVDAAEKFNQGYMTTELVAANVIDQAWHQLKAADVPAAEGVTDFEAAALRKAGGAPEQEHNRGEDCGREMQTGRSPAAVAQCIGKHARSYTPKASKVISANPDRRTRPATSAVS